MCELKTDYSFGHNTGCNLSLCAAKKKKKKFKGFKNFTYVYAQRKPFGHTFYDIGSKHIVSEELHVKVVRC